MILLLEKKNLFLEIINNKSNRSYIIPCLILLGIYFTHYMFFVPFWPLDHDTFYKLLSVKNEFEFDYRDHQHWRWGSYIIYKIFLLFFDQNFITITSTSLVLFLLSALLFTYCVHINLGLFFSLIFTIFWITSKSLNYEIFSFSVVNQSLLPLAVLMFCMQRIKQNDLNLLNAIIISVVFFWLYSIKETNVFFFPLLFFFNNIRHNLNFVLKIILICLFFYFLETVFFNFLTDEQIFFGRIFSLLSDKSPVFNEMADMEYAKMHGVNFNLEKFFLIFYRWYSAREWDTTIFYFSFIFSIVFLLNRESYYLSKNNFKILNSLLVLSFFLFTTFFIISLFPPILGQPLNTRYLTVLLPFSYISIIIFIKIFINQSSYKLLSIILLSIVLTTFLSRPIFSLLTIDENFHYLSFTRHKGNSVFDRYNQYNKLYNSLNKYDCLIIDSINPWVKLTLAEGLPLLLNKKINNDEWEYIEDTDKLLRKISSNACNNKLIIKENGIIFN